MTFTRKLFNTEFNIKNMDAAILVVRVLTGIFMLVHGLPKFEELLGPEPIQFVSVFGMSPTLSLAMAVFAEVFCSVLIIIGLGTRLATIPLIITMLVAVLHIHGADPFVKQEMGLHYLLVYILLLISGSGRYSMDRLINKSNANRKAVDTGTTKNF